MIEIVEERSLAATEWRPFYADAFPDEDLSDLVQNLLAEETGILSLIFRQDQILRGHAIFTDCLIEESDTLVSLLGPVAVVPDLQRSGIGTALINTGLQMLDEAGFSLVLVLGDPAYYQRFGFAAEPDIEPPFRIPDEWRLAWQSRFFGQARNKPRGKLVVPEPWQKPELWT